MENTVIPSERRKIIIQKKKTYFYYLFFFLFFHVYHVSVENAVVYELLLMQITRTTEQLNNISICQTFSGIFRHFKVFISLFFSLAIMSADFEQYCHAGGFHVNFQYKYTPINLINCGKINTQTDKSVNLRQLNF